MIILKWIKNLFKKKEPQLSEQFLMPEYNFHVLLMKSDIPGKYRLRIFYVEKDKEKAKDISLDIKSNCRDLSLILEEMLSYIYNDIRKAHNERKK